MIPFLPDPEVLVLFYGGKIVIALFVVSLVTLLMFIISRGQVKRAKRDEKMSSLPFFQCERTGIQAGFHRAGRGGAIYDRKRHIIVSFTDDGEYYIGRTMMDVPSEDGVIYVEFKDGVMINDFIKVKVIDSTEYDLLAVVL